MHRTEGGSPAQRPSRLGLGTFFSPLTRVGTTPDNSATGEAAIQNGQLAQTNEHHLTFKATKSTILVSRIFRATADLITKVAKKAQVGNKATRLYDEIKNKPNKELSHAEKMALLDFCKELADKNKPFPKLPPILEKNELLKTKVNEKISELMTEYSSSTSPLASNLVSVSPRYFQALDKNQGNNNFPQGITLKDLTPAQVAVLSSKQLRNFTNEKLSEITPIQYKALSEEAKSGLSDDQFASLIKGKEPLTWKEAAPPPAEKKDVSKNTLVIKPKRIVVLGGFTNPKTKKKAESLLNPLVPPGLAPAYTSYQQLDDSQIKKDMGRALNQIGDQLPPPAPEGDDEAEHRNKEYQKLANDYITKECPTLKDAERMQVQRFAFERLSETNSNPEGQAAIALAIGNPKIRLADSKHSTPNQMTITKKSKSDGSEEAFLIIEKRINSELKQFSSNPEVQDLDPTESYGTAEAIVRYEIPIEAILSDQAGWTPPIITVTIRPKATE